ncbi:tRNA pseudouridine(13) synthase TruD [Halorussus salilacus]|uniref:tRNA pseudouridine(13) synthase TruD n=1 Tax=Halorussus salilacus TaxID=2953750 RepID=UPI0020A03A81|nr:tRNA pseudouridine(13) synthase TruD [Halorussus salilacus]USZ69180.1 tRNA pseudouridine(13) synthase TruD [Halorussus salilacus]
MREAYPVERAVGIERFVTDAEGIGGRLRAENADFRVREVERFDAEPADADPGAYPHLVVRATLRGWDTNDFARRLSDALGISRERVSWAGTKDKHAVTTQLFSLRKVDPADLSDVEIRDADVDIVGRSGRGLEFGDLAGNAFEIAVRDADRPENADEIREQLAEFGGAPDDEPTAVGVPDFFGQQRFGSRRPVTHEVGLRVVREDWEGAVRAYVADAYETEPEGTREARREAADAFEQRDWQGVLDALPRRLGFERAMANRLVENGGDGPEDFRAALEAVPSNLQRLFVNAAQSYAFNRILSERLARGLPFDRPVEGDVVCFSERVDGLTVPDTDRLQEVTQNRVETVARHCERGRAFVTAPLVGTETELGDGEPGEIEREVLDELDLEPADFDLPGEFGSTGTRRAVLVRTDLDVAVEDDAVTFAFALPKGSYATVVLREFMKTDPAKV